MYVVRFMFYPDTGINGAGEGVGGNAEKPEDVDYKALFEKYKSDYEKIKKSFDSTASEIAEMKKANKAKMSEDEKKELELAEEREKFKATINQLNEYKTDNVFAENGFEKNSYKALSQKLVESCGEGASEVAEIIVKFVESSNKLAIANEKAKQIRNGSVLPNGESKNEEHTYAKIALESNNPNNKAEEIKNYYINKEKR